MTPGKSPMRSRGATFTSVALVAALTLAALVFHKPIIAWFTGKSLGREGTPVDVQAGPFALEAALDPDPPRRQGNALVVDVKDGSGKAVDDATVGVFFDMPAMGAMAEMKGGARVSRESGGRYRAEFDLPMGSGTWTLKVAIHASQGDANQDFTFTVGSAGLGSGSRGAAPRMSASGAAPLVAAVRYPPAVYDALHAAVDAYDRIRLALAADRVAGVGEAARTVAEALRGAASAMTKEQSDAADRARLAAESADRVASARSLEDARKAFGDLNRQFLRVIGADARLTDGRRVFECDMFEGEPRWTQRAATADNPYTGAKMPACGVERAWASGSTVSAPGGDASPGEIDHYTCSMHPSVKQKGPGACPLCGMALIAVTREQQEQGVVMIDEARRQLIGVRTGRVIEGPMRDTFRAVGRVAYDESGLSDVNLKVRGWITKLFVSQTGQRVTKGQTLFTMYSPELYNAEQDLVLATQGAAESATAPPEAGGRGDSLARAARQRLKLLGLDDAQIDAVAKKGAPMESVSISSPASGFVIEKDVVEGASVEAGMRLFRIAALGRVWVEADVYEADLARVRVGQAADVTLDYLPGRSYEAKVAYVYPYLDAKVRTGRVRVVIANKQLDLRPGMYASVELGADVGTRVQVPAAAVVYTGPRRLVFIDLGDGRFKPQEIQVGTEAHGMYEVLVGLEPGDRVATSGVFLIAAEARISTAATYWESSPEYEDGGTRDSSVAPGGSVTPPMPGMPGMPSMPAPWRTGDGKGPTTPGPPPASSHGASTTRPPSASAGPTVYACPMHPEARSPTPGKCPKCGMDLQPMGGKP